MRNADQAGALLSSGGIATTGPKVSHWSVVLVQADALLVATAGRLAS